jgi:phytoene dehydrogenase-like protein
MWRLTRGARGVATASAPLQESADVVILGGGHNGLVSAAYLARAGLNVCVLERRHVLGGAAVTEELVPGFRYSRASYLAGLLRPQVVKDLQLERHGLRYLVRDPSSFTPSLPGSRHGGKSLLLHGNMVETQRSIAQFSARDAAAYPAYEAFLGSVRQVVNPLIDGPPLDFAAGGRWRERLAMAGQAMGAATAAARQPAGTVAGLMELFAAPAEHILDRWFESDILKATLATDAVIGALVSPRTPGSGYVLLHHVMGEVAGRPGVWAYVQGGMGALSGAIAKAAMEAGAKLHTGAEVDTILVNDAGTAVQGVRLVDGRTVRAPVVLSNATPHTTFLELLADGVLPDSFRRHIEHADYSCGAFKINLALSRLPQFACMPGTAPGEAGPQHRGTVHFETTVEEIHAAFLDASAGRPAVRPVVEMTLPSVLDATLVDTPGTHVAGLFVQFAPYTLANGASWADERFKSAFVDRVLVIVEEHCPGFKQSILHYDALSPLDLERTFGLHQGNIFHGALSLHQLAHNRPAPGWSSHRTPLAGLYLAGAGAHPGGGVTGAPGRNAAGVVLSDLGVGMR